MDALDVDALRARRNSVQKKLSEARRDLRNMLRKQRARMLQLSPSGKVLRTALAVYVLAGYEAAPAVQYLSEMFANRGWPAPSRNALETLVEDAFLAASPAELAHLCDTVAPLSDEVFKSAARVVEEWRLAVWTARLNREVGLAPPTSMCAARHAQCINPYPEHVRPQALGSGTSAGGRKRAARWRVRWGGRIGATSARDDMPRDEKSGKAFAL